MNPNVFRKAIPRLFDGDVDGKSYSAGMCHAINAITGTSFGENRDIKYMSDWSENKGGKPPRYSRFSRFFLLPLIYSNGYQHIPYTARVLFLELLALLAEEGQEP
jgi:hypothetical protein